MRKRYTEEQKLEITKLYENGSSVKSLCDKFNVAKSALYNWIHLYKASIVGKGYAISPRQYYLLEKQMRKLKAENEILYKCGCSSKSPLKDKLIAMEALRSEYMVHALCRVLDVRRSTFYHYIFRHPKQTVIAKDDEIFKPKIKEIFDKSEGRLGSKKIRAIMMNQGFTISAERIVRLMRELDISCYRADPMPKYPKANKNVHFKNKLNQRFKQSEPNAAWVSDVTYIKVKDSTFYVCAVIDLFARKVISHNVADENSTKLIKSTFLDAFTKRNAPQSLMFHSDRGTQYTAYSFRKKLRELKVNQSFSNTACPYDNAVAESFFSSLKKEELSRRHFETIDDLQKSVKGYVEFFNSERPHQSLGYLTPDTVEQRYWDMKKVIV